MIQPNIMLRHARVGVDAVSRRCADALAQHGGRLAAAEEKRTKEKDEETVGELLNGEKKHPVVIRDGRPTLFIT